MKRIYSKLLSVAQQAYRTRYVNWALKHVPYTFKREVRNFLLRRASGEHAGISLPVEDLPEHPQVSILIPVYNHADYLNRCIDSAIAQTWPNVEVIIVDDCSPDPRVASILATYRHHPRVRLFHNAENLGIALTQNRALVESAGYILGFLDCDDYLAADAVEICMASWKPDTVYSHSGRINVDEQDVEVNRIHFVELPRENYFEENLNAMYATHFKMIKREAFARVGLFDPRFDSAQDYDMLMRIAFHYPSSAFVHVPDFVYFHRFHPKQTTEVQNTKQLWCTETIQKEARLRQAIHEGRFDKLISIVMLSYGKHTQTLEALQSLARTVRIPHEIILYDNGSDEATVEFIKQHIEGKFPTLKVYYGDRNLGPARGRREALKHAHGTWFVVFDNDEIAEPGWLEELLVRAQAYENVGAVNCRVVFPNHALQFSGGRVEAVDEQIIKLELYDFGKKFYDLSACDFKEVDWCPIGATLFTSNVAEYLHDGYPNTFEDAGVSFSLKRKGMRLLNAPGALVWHEHVNFRPKVDMHERYMSDRYNPKLMLKSVASFFSENGLIIFDEYIWRENALNSLPRDVLIEKLLDASKQPTVFPS